MLTASSSDESLIEFDSAFVTKYRESKEGVGCLRGEWRHDKSVSSAYWDPRGRSIVSTSYDDAIRSKSSIRTFFVQGLRFLVWDIHSPAFEGYKPFPSTRPFCRISHNCQTVYVSLTP